MKNKIKENGQKLIPVSLLGMSGKPWEWFRHPGNIYKSCGCLWLKVFFLMELGVGSRELMESASGNFKIYLNLLDLYLPHLLLNK